MESAPKNTRETEKPEADKVSILDLQMHRPETPKTSPDFIGWAKKGKGATCS